MGEVADAWVLATEGLAAILKVAHILAMPYNLHGVHLAEAHGGLRGVGECGSLASYLTISLHPYPRISSFCMWRSQHR